MATTTFDDADVRAAMRTFLETSQQLEDASTVGSQARSLLDLAEAKSIAAMVLRRRLTELGWTAPAKADAVVPSATPADHEGTCTS